MKRIFLLGTLALSLLLALGGHLAHAAEPPGQLQGKYISPTYLTNVPFGTRSHWLQPWRSYLDTVPASTLVNNIGVVDNLFNRPGRELGLELLKRMGFRHVRIEISWGHFDYKDETRLLNAERFRQRLQLIRAKGMRPLVQINAHHGKPCPSLTTTRTLTTDAQEGERVLTLNDTHNLVLGYSGVSRLERKLAAEGLITAIEGNRITLSKPIPTPMKAGDRVEIVTLKYRPFGVVGTPDYNETREGWKRYVLTIGKFVEDALGTENAADKGYDLECWNELSFGSCFTDINYYYTPPLAPHRPTDTFKDLICATAEAVNSQAALFSGVEITNGFATTIPWPASTELPTRVKALSKHPYFKRYHFPAQEQRDRRINALGKRTPEGFVPTYTAWFPEVTGTGVGTNLILRDTAPFPIEIYRVAHGRNARKQAPCPLWITEFNVDCVGEKVTDPKEALKLKAKCSARALCFFFNKGVERFYFFGLGPNDDKMGDLELGMVPQSLLEYAKDHTEFPTEKAILQSPVLEVIRNLVNTFQKGMDSRLTKTRPLELVSVTDTHHHFQFEGDGTEAHPSLYNREVFAFLPFQVNERKFVIPYYVMTRDLRKDLAPEDYTITVEGIQGRQAKVSAYDPMQDRKVPVQIKTREANRLELSLTAADYPYLLTIEE